MDDSSFHYSGRSPLDDLSNELRTALEKRQVLEKQVNSLQADAAEKADKCQKMRERIEELEKELWLTKERCAF